MQCYDILPNYVPGKEIYIADALSRMSLSNNEDIKFDEIMEKDIAAQACILSMNIMDEKNLADIDQGTRTDQNLDI